MGLAKRASAPKQQLFLGHDARILFAFFYKAMLWFLFNWPAMTPQELKKLKEELLVEATKLEGLLDEFTTKNPIVKGDRQSHLHQTDSSDTLDEKAHGVTDSEQERAVEQNMELRLREIKETIKKIDAGTYGICEKCVSPIDTRRLKVVPIARFCVDCTKKVKLL